MNNNEQEIKIQELKDEIDRLKHWLHLAPTIVQQKILSLEELSNKALKTKEHALFYDPFQTSFGTDG